MALVMSSPCFLRLVRASEILMSGARDAALLGTHLGIDAGKPALFGNSKHLSFPCLGQLNSLSVMDEHRATEPGVKESR